MLPLSFQSEDRSEQEGFSRKTFPTCTKFKEVRLSAGEQPHASGRCTANAEANESGRGQRTKAVDRGRKPGRRGGLPKSPESPLPRTRCPNLGSAPPPPFCLRLLRRVPAPGSLVRTSAPLTHREGIYVAASSLLTDARRWGPQTSNAAPAAAPRRPRQL